MILLIFYIIGVVFSLIYLGIIRGDKLPYTLFISVFYPIIIGLLAILWNVIFIGAFVIYICEDIKGYVRSERKNAN